MKKLLVAVLILVSAVLFAGTVSVIGPWSGVEMDAFIPVLEAFKAETGIDYTYPVSYTHLTLPTKRIV